MTKLPKKNVHPSYKLGHSDIILKDVDVQPSYIGKARRGQGRPAKFSGRYAGHTMITRDLYNSIMYIKNNGASGTIKKVKWELYVDIIDELIRLGVIDDMKIRRKRILACMLYTAFM